MARKRLRTTNPHDAGKDGGDGGLDAAADDSGDAADDDQLPLRSVQLHDARYLRVLQLLLLLPLIKHVINC